MKNMFEKVKKNISIKIKAVKKRKTTNEVKEEEEDNEIFEELLDMKKEKKERKHVLDIIGSNFTKDTKQRNHSSASTYLSGDDESHKRLIQSFQREKGLDFRFLNIEGKSEFKYYTDMKELEHDWDLKDNKAFEDNYLMLRDRNKIIEPEKRKAVAQYAAKYQILKDNFLLIGTGRQEWNKGKKAVGMLFPTPQIINFYMNEIFFVSPSIASAKYSSHSQLNIFDGKIVNTNKLYAYIQKNDYTDVCIYKYDTYNWICIGVRNGRNEIIDNEFLNNNEAMQLIDKLLLDISRNRGDKSSEIVGTKHISLSTMFENDKEQAVIMDEGSFRISLIRQSKAIPNANINEIDRMIHIRCLESSGRLRKINDIGYMPEHLNIILKALLENNTLVPGMSIFLGQPGSAKSTTIYSLFKHIWEEYGQMIVTLETILEFDVPGFRSVALDDTSSATNPDIKMTYERTFDKLQQTFTNGVIFGEIIEKTQIESFVKAAARGRMVASTMHTNDNHSAFTTFENNGISSISYNNLIKLLVHHDLKERVCQTCKGSKKSDELEECRECSGKGCENCNQTGKIETLCPKCAGTGVDGKELIYEITYFPPKAVPGDAKLHGDDYWKLIRENKIVHISKESVAKAKWKKGLISEEIYKQFDGTSKREIMKIAEKINEAKVEEEAKSAS